MAKIITRIVTLALALSIALTQNTPVAADNPPTDTPISVHGYVTKNGDKTRPVKKAYVSISCAKYSTTVRTNENGFYRATIAREKCPVGSKITVACFDFQDGQYYGSVTSQSKEDNNIDLSIFPNHEAPEYGSIAGVTAGGVAIGIIIVTRRRFMLKKDTTI